MGDLCAEINKFGKGVSNPARYRIVEALLTGPKTVSQLVKVAKMSQPAVSQHLKTLKECALVTDERRGQEVYYSVNASHTIKLLKKLTEEMGKREKK
jgi:ArsR family transcriptional regulator, arsenate/arsenite/antimonite-responsive transcriptional repressor